MGDVTAKDMAKMAAAKSALVTPAGAGENYQKHYRRFPTSAYLRRAAPRHVPLFSFEYGDTGAGDDVGVNDNWAAFDAIKIAARYGVINELPPVEVELCGAFFLAAAGVLDGRRATTHWEAVEALKRFRPAIDVEGDAIHVEDCGVWTSAGVTAGMDLALAMIEADHGRAMALSIARRHVIFRIRPGGQSQFSAELAAQAVTGNPKIEKLAQSIVAAPNRNWCTDVLATEAGVSQRSLSRLFRAGLDVSPAVFVERVRVDLAR
ncbi:MAG: DJ-1/PfpI family protein [Pseudolabrys sp.]